jgi:hypothetical protein
LPRYVAWFFPDHSGWGLVRPSGQLPFKEQIIEGSCVIVVLHFVTSTALDIGPAHALARVDVAVVVVGSTWVTVTCFTTEWIGL